MRTEQPPARRRELVRAIVLLLVVQGAAIALYAWVQRDRTPPPRLEAEQMDSIAPALAFARADGSRGTLADLRGRPVLVHFWATWCVPCREELPQLLSLGRAMAGDMAVIAVAVEDDWDAIGRFFSGPPPPQVVAEADDGRRRYGVSTLPDTFLVGAAGDLRLRFHGPRDWARAEMRAVLLPELR